MTKDSETRVRAILDEASALCWDPFEGDETDCLILSDKIVTGRKDYRCQHCNGPIHKGERHRARAEINREEGARGTFRFCADCLNADALDQSDGEDRLEKRYQLYPEDNSHE